MKEIFEMYAKYNQAGNKGIYDLLTKLDNEDREKDRGSYYGSLSGLLRHVMGGTFFFMGMYKSALTGNAGAQKALASLEGIVLPEGKLSGAQWKELGSLLEKIDAAYVGMAAALEEANLKAPVKIEWYGGNPAEVPLSFLLHQLVVHNTHHRGQISQILDSLQIKNDYSGINIAFMPR
ncbi:MAG: damage-inducible protein DinB [Treponema sp.]|jgi:uncharacterized damage-inducible protein DinB|nr:damage-inducible protein DinB [Treponema sp.]